MGVSGGCPGFTSPSPLFEGVDSVLHGLCSSRGGPRGGAGSWFPTALVQSVLRSLWVPVPPGMLSRALLLHEVASVSPSVNEGAVPEGP